MGRRQVTMCRIHFCQTVKTKLCCVECSRQDKCPDVCLNHPSRCGCNYGGEPGNSHNKVTKETSVRIAAALKDGRIPKKSSKKATSDSK